MSPGPRTAAEAGAWAAYGICSKARRWAWSPVRFRWWRRPGTVVVMSELEATWVRWMRGRMSCRLEALRRTALPDSPR